MPTQTIQRFGGLDLRDDVQEAQGAIDCLNVELDRPGQVRTRDGFSSVAVASSTYGTVLMPLVKAATNTTSPTYGVYNVIQAPGPTGQLIDSLTGAGVGGVGTARLPNQTSFTQFGTPTTDYLYIAGDSASRGVSTSRGTVQKWDGTTLSNGVGAPFYVAATPWDNRLVQAGFAAAAGSPALSNGSQSTVWFSDAGAPDSYNGVASQNAYVHLHPGDGERITGVCVWRDKLIVTKESRMFVFFGTSADSTGQPVFNYRTVNLPGGVPENLSRAIVAGDDAFYILTNNGVYASTGGPPQSISRPIDRALYGPVPATWTDYASAPIFLGLSYALRRVWVHVGTSTPSTRSFVLDLESGQWSYSSIGTHVLENATRTGVYFVGSGFDNQTVGTVYLTSQSTTTDAGSAISSRYRLGFYDGGIPEQEKWLRSMMLSGTGTVNVKTAINDAAALSSATSVAMGTSPAVGTGRWSAGTRGRNISVEVSATSGQWSLSHLSMDIGGVRAPGVRAA